MLTTAIKPRWAPVRGVTGTAPTECSREPHRGTRLDRCRRKGWPEAQWVRAVVHQGHAQAFRKAIRDRRSRLYRFEQPLFRPQTLGLVIARTFDREGWVTTDGVSHTAHRALSIPFSWSRPPIDLNVRKHTPLHFSRRSAWLARSLPLSCLAFDFRMVCTSAADPLKLRRRLRPRRAAAFRREGEGGELASRQARMASGQHV